MDEQFLPAPENRVRGTRAADRDHRVARDPVVAPDRSGARRSLALALYGRTRYCGAWTRIKRWYASAGREQQERAQRIYIRSFGAYLLLRGKRLSRHIEQYRRKRGMEFRHGVHDWLGGYPYESIRPGELHALLERSGFARVKQIVKRRSGLFGSGCDEYVYRKT